MSTYNGTTGPDTYTGTPDNDVINGLDGNDVLNGAAGNDVIDGGTGADTMTGGLGDDIFYVDSINDVTREAKNQGYDTVFATVSYSLAGQFVEALHLTGSDAIDATGNTLDNVISGNAAANVLDGYSGNDILDGGAGADTMKGGNGDDTFYVDNVGDVLVEAKSDGYDTAYSSVSYALSANVEELHLTGTAGLSATGNASDNAIFGTSGANLLDGGVGADHLVGGLGNDTYVVDNAGDVVTEDASAGTDLVQSSVSYGLGANIENLTLTGTANINGTGNDLANTLTGNGGNNLLNGAAGADKMIGGAGNDTFIVDNTGDVCREADGQGTDTVQSSVSYSLAGQYIEQLVLTGTGSTNGTGNSLANTLIGNSGDNVLSGLMGADTMVGGGGADTFFFYKSDFHLLNGDVDRITDFVHPQGDKIDLSNVDAISGGSDDAFTFIGSAAFDGHAGELRFEQTSNEFGMLTGDTNGDGVADFSIRVDGAPNFVAADFNL